MVNNILAAVLCLCLIGLMFIGKLTLSHFGSKKRMTFIALLIPISMTVLGYLMEITAGTAEGGRVAIKLLYFGMIFLSPAFLVFVFEYFDMKINKWIIGGLFAIGLFLLSLIWTTEHHGLIYESIDYITDLPVHSIRTVRGPLFFTLHVYTMGVAVPAVILLIYKLFTYDAKYRVNIILIIAGALAPAISNILFLFKLNIYEMNYVPISMTVVCVVFYYNIIRRDMFDILPKANQIALQSMREAFILIDRDKNFLHANEAASELLPEIKSLPFELTSDENNKIITPVKFDIPENNYYNANISPLIGDKNILLGYIIIIQDITESVLLTKKLEEIAYRDSLTGISNRQHFMNLASAQFERMKRNSGNSFIIMFDIDYFKKVNDTYGHIVGDKVLKCLAEKVNREIRPYDIFGRYGGEEFILFVSDISEEDIKIQAERIREAICCSPMVFEEAALTVSASFGVASVMSSDNFVDVIKLADEALYKAKADGRNRVVMADIPVSTV